MSTSPRRLRLRLRGRRWLLLAGVALIVLVAAAVLGRLVEIA